MMSSTPPSATDAASLIPAPIDMPLALELASIEAKQKINELNSQTAPINSASSSPVVENRRASSERKMKGEMPEWAKKFVVTTGVPLTTSTLTPEADSNTSATPQNQTTESISESTL